MLKTPVGVQPRAPGRGCPSSESPVKLAVTGAAFWRQPECSPYRCDDRRGFVFPRLMTLDGVAEKSPPNDTHKHAVRTLPALLVLADAVAA